MNQLLDIIKTPPTQMEWTAKNQEAFDALFGGGGGGIQLKLRREYN